MLWGEDVSSLYGKTISTGGGKYVEVLPTSMSATTPDVAGMLTCLSCHDGNFAPLGHGTHSLPESHPVAGAHEFLAVRVARKSAHASQVR